MSARDELAKLLFRHGVSDGGGRAADAILAAGYSKPRTITTVEELDALPVGAAILTNEDEVIQRHERRWYATGPSQWPFMPNEIALPATVLYTPKES